ncbi:hypothetical protein [Chitinasiproducens palmae]|uniref:hypothetical protein n=1 Tax=Chitinasiproducens palmae TaxID=1770053 RepID=UPI0011142BAB|nr:hypothetical protein [Chitinasiproducens palmae]
MQAFVSSKEDCLGLSSCTKASVTSSWLVSGRDGLDRRARAAKATQAYRRPLAESRGARPGRVSSGVKEWLHAKLGGVEHRVFNVLFPDTHHRPI